MIIVNASVEFSNPGITRLLHVAVDCTARTATHSNLHVFQSVSGLERGGFTREIYTRSQMNDNIPSTKYNIQKYVVQ